MVNIKLESMKIKDAKRFYEILNNENFIYFIKVKSIEQEKEFLRKNKEKEKQGIGRSYAIIYENKIVGGCGIKIDQHRKYIGELGYFIDEAYWGKGIATAAVKELEEICFNELNMSRLEILIHTKNKSSEKVAIKSGYKKEGIQRKKIEVNGEMNDCYLYAKVL